jgi:hypothetical protein
MKTRHFFLLTLLVALFASCSKNNDRQRFGLKGEVKTFVEHYYEVEESGDEWQIGQQLGYGNNKVYFSEDGLYQKVHYFNEEDKFIGKLVPERDGDKIVSESYIDESGEVTSTTKISHPGKDIMEFEGYDLEGNLINKGKTIYENHRLVSQEYTAYYDGDTIVFISSYTYDENGNIKTQLQKDDGESEGSTFSFEYLKFDEKGNWTERLDYDNEMGEKPIRKAIREYTYYK